MFYRRGPRQQGFSLLESVIAATVFALGATFVAGLWPTLTRANLASRNKFIAVHLATRVLEHYSQEAKGGVTPVAETGDFKVTTVANSVQTETTYHYEVTVNALAPRLSDVLVTVSWRYQDQQHDTRQEIVLHS